MPLARGLAGLVFWPSFAEVFLVLHKLELIKARYIFVFGLGLIF